MNYNTTKVADKIRATAKEKRVPIKVILADCGLGVNAISQFSAGKVMSSFNLAKIADRLDVSVDYLLGRTNNPSTK